MKTPRFYLEHILEHTRYLMRVSTGLKQEDFLADRTLILAVERSLGIIGEAVARIDAGFRAAHPEVPWRKIRALRNVVTHMYWAVDYDIIWHVVTVEVPALHDQVERMLKTLP